MENKHIHFTLTSDGWWMLFFSFLLSTLVYFLHVFVFLHVFPTLGMEILQTVQNRIGPWFLILRAPFKEDEPLNPVVHKHLDSGLFRPVVGGSPGRPPLPSLQRSPALPPGRRGHGWKVAATSQGSVWAGVPRAP